jgi:hypothetical protein
LVERGYTPKAADETVRGVNRVMSAGLGFAAGVAFHRRRWFLGSILTLLAALALALGIGLIEE